MIRALLLIFAFLALIIGSFIWFVATWDREGEESLSLILPKISPPEAPAPTTSVTWVVTHLTPPKGLPA